MKHDSDIRRLQALSEPLGITVTCAQASLLIQHLALVLEANRGLNLTGITDFDEALRLHVVDSLTVMPHLVGDQAAQVIDLGSGAGYPGIPIAIMGASEVLLLEPRRRRAEFLESVASVLELGNLTIRAQRAEQLALSDQRSRATTVTARAVSSLPALVELAAPLLQTGGRLCAMKGPIGSDELSRGKRASLLVGLELSEIVRFSLPEGGEARTLVIFTKSGEPEAQLPRAPGRAQKSPLA